MGNRHFTIKHSSNLLWVSIFDSWDELEIYEYDTQIRKIVMDNYNNKEWGTLLDLSSWELNTPIAENEAKKHVAWVIKNGLTTLAVVLGQKSLHLWQYRKISKNMPIKNHKLFNSIEEAKEWLLQKNYEIPE